MEREEIRDSYGAEVAVSHSSAAMAPHMWLWTEGGSLSEDGGVNDGSAHLNLEQARWLRDKLTEWVDYADAEYARARETGETPYLELYDLYLEESENNE